MASGFIVRTLAAIGSAIRGDMRREMPGTDATVWPNTNNVLAKVVAMAMQLVEQRAAWIYRQVFASTADRAQLERQAYEFGIARRQASSATGPVLTTGTPNAVYPGGIAFVSAGGVYRTNGDARASGNGDLILYVYAETAGAAGNRDEGDTLTLVDPALYPTLAATASVMSATIGGGADAETDDQLRARVLDRKRRPPQGGAYSDYEQIALAMPGVIKAWAWPFANGPGTVGVWFLFDDRPNYIPTPSDVAELHDRIEARKLIRAGLSVAAPVPQPLDVTIASMSVDTDDVRDRISAALTDMLFDRGRPGVAVEPFVLSRSWIGEAISGAIGEERHVLASPAEDITYSNGAYPVLGTVSYV